MPSNKDSNRGFTLIELTIVVAIIGILAAIAVPDFLKFTAKSKQVEAKGMLPLIASYEYDHKFKNGSFIACPLNPAEPGGYWDENMEGWKELGFSPKGKLYYSYEVVIEDERLRVKAIGNVDDDPVMDEWLLKGDSLTMLNTTNDPAMDSY